MAKESTVGVRIETGSARSDIAQLTTAINAMAKSFETSNRTLTSQQSTLKESTKYLSNIAKASRETSSAIRSSSASNTEMRNSLNALKASLASSNAEMSRMGNVIRTLRSDNQGLSSTVSQLSAEQVKSSGVIKTQSDALKRLREDLKNTGSETGKANKESILFNNSLARLAKTYILFTGSRAALNTLRDFEYTMAQVGFVTDATTEQFQQLNDTARNLGATTQYSASQAAEGMKYLGLAGLDTNQILSSMPNVLNMATASAMDLGAAADIVAKLMTSFNMGAASTGRIGDILVQTMRSSNTTVEQLGEALKYVAPIAASANINLEESAAILGTVANAGIQASMAGTGFRRVIQAFLKPAPRAAQAFKDLGLSIEDVSLKTGSLIGIIRKLNEAGLADSPELATAIADIRGGPFLQALVANVDTFEQLIKMNEEAIGVSKEGADILDNTLRGSFKQFTSAVQEATLAVGAGGLIGVLRWLADMGTGVVRNLTGVTNGINETGMAVELLTRGFQGLIAFTLSSKVLAGVELLRKIVTVGGVAAGAAGGPLAWIAIAAGATAFFWDDLKGLFSEQEKVKESLTGLKGELIDLDRPFKSASESAKDFAMGLSDIDSDIDTNFAESIYDSLVKVEGQTTNVTSAINRMIDETVQSQKKAQEDLIEILTPSPEALALAEAQSSWVTGRIFLSGTEKETLKNTRETLDMISEAAESLNVSDLFDPKQLQDFQSLFKEIGDTIYDDVNPAVKAWAMGLSSISDLIKAIESDSNIMSISFASKIMSALAADDSAREDREKRRSALEVKNQVSEWKMQDVKFKANFEVGEVEAELRKAKGLWEEGYLSEAEWNEANSIAQDQIKRIWAGVNKTNDAEAKRFARERERMLSSMMKAIMPEEDFGRQELAREIAEAERLGIDAKTVATYERIKLMDIEEKAQKDFTSSMLDEFKLQEEMGLMSKEVVAEGLRTLLAQTEANTPAWLEFSKALVKVNEELKKMAESQDKMKLDSLKDALDTIKAEFEVGRFEVLKGEDVDMQRAMLEELLQSALKADQSIQGMPQLIRAIRNEIDGVKDTTNLAKEASMEWASTLEKGIVQAIMGAKSLSDALSEVIAKMAEFLIQQALFGGGGLLEGVFGDLFGGLVGGGASPSPVSAPVSAPTLPSIPGKPSPKQGTMYVPKENTMSYAPAQTSSYSPSISVQVNVENKGEMDQEQANRLGKTVSDIIEIKQAEFMRKQQRSGGAFKTAYSGVVL